MTPPKPIRIAMWSGPRNISTALMRSWDARGDAFVSDEPLYSHYLQQTGLDHPGAEEVIARHERDWRKVVQWLTGPIPEGRAIFYQKHMSHHLLPDVGREWLDHVTNCFLIREPREMLTSLAKVIPDPSVEQTGLPQQVEIFESVRQRSGGPPAVIDSRDVLLDPPGVLRRLCERVGVPWTDRMLCWAPGPRATDGVWARHWYDAVERSTGFASYRPKDDVVPEHLRGVFGECQTLYERLYEHRIRAADR